MCDFSLLCTWYHRLSGGRTDECSSYALCMLPRVKITNGTVSGSKFSLYFK